MIHPLSPVLRVQLKYLVTLHLLNLKPSMLSLQRHAAERKAVKHEIALLKLRRKKLRKKFPKEAAEKREINKKIKTLIKDITEKQQKELKELGIVKSTQTNEFAEEDVDMDN